MPRTVVVADRVWERWRELSADSTKPWVALLFTSQLETEVARRKLGDAVGRVVSEFEQNEDPPAGAWNLARVPEGVMLTVGEKCGAFELLLQRVVDELEQDGVTGSFDLYELPEVARPPKLTDLLEARLRVNGERFPQGYHYGWAADREALWRVTAAGAGWCLENPPERGVSLQVRTLPPLPVPAADDVETLLREGMASAESLGIVVLRSIGFHRFRSLAIEPSRGRVSLVDGGSAIHGDGWVDSVRELIELVRATSRELVYGFVKRGSSTFEAESGSSLSSQRGDAFEDRYVPGAFGIQLLGPGHADRIPAGPEWHQTSLDAGRVLLEHRQFDAWMRVAQLEEVLRGGKPSNEEALARARKDFEPLLFREELAERPQ